MTLKKLLFCALLVAGVQNVATQEAKSNAHANAQDNKTNLKINWLQNVNLFELRNLDKKNIAFTTRIQDLIELTTFGEGNITTELRHFRKRINTLLYDNAFVKKLNLETGWLEKSHLNELRGLDESNIGFTNRIQDFITLTTFGEGDITTELKQFRLRINAALYDNEIVKQLDLEAGWLQKLQLYELRHLDEADIDFANRIDGFIRLTTFGEGDITTELKALRQRINVALYDNEIVKEMDLEAGWLKNLHLYELRYLDESKLQFTNRVDDFITLTTFGEGDITSELKDFRQRINTMLYDNEVVKKMDLEAGWLKKLQLYKLRDLDESKLGFTKRIDDFKELTTFGEGDINTELEDFRKRINTMLYDNKVAKEVINKDGTVDPDKLKNILMNFSLETSN